MLDPPAIEKPPPTMSCPFERTASAFTRPTTPDPRLDQLAPFQRAIPFADAPPAKLKAPPAIKSPLTSTVIARTSPLMPVLMPDQLVPFHRAMLLTATSPARPNMPAATREPSASTVSAFTTVVCWVVPRTPEPRADHSPDTRSNTAMLFAGVSPARPKLPPMTSLGVTGPDPSASHTAVVMTGPFVPRKLKTPRSNGCQTGSHCPKAVSVRNIDSTN